MYGPLLEQTFPYADVTMVGENSKASCYSIEGTGEAHGRRMRVFFSVGADEEHFPVALASMGAKLVRELAMARFNRFFCERLAELKPTAGYTIDGRRWLRDAAQALTEYERTTLPRRA